MPQTALTGTRIRERRLARGMRQADLARAAGISGSYLNLIEHNRRRIGGKLLHAIARILEVEPQALSEGAEAAMLDALRAAAGRMRMSEAELDRAEEFASRFPGWAALVTGQDARVAALEARVATLADRMAHDPALAAALHEIISSVTSIRSTSAILAGEDEVDPHWQRRFHRNIDDDARRLAQSSTALVSYLEAGQGTEAEGAAPVLSAAEEVAAFLAAEGPSFAALEGGEDGTDEAITETVAGLHRPAARAFAAAHLARYAEDAAAMPQEALRAALAETGMEPAALARRFGTGPAAVLRRIAALPPRQGDRPAGLVICDASGALVHLQPVAGFSPPRVGGACPLWPLYRALSAPGLPIREEVVLPGAQGERLLCFAIAGPRALPAFGEMPVLEATMLLLPWPEGAGGAARPVGLGCQVCPREDCAARREPSLIEA